MTGLHVQRIQTHNLRSLLLLSTVGKYCNQWSSSSTTVWDTLRLSTQCISKERSHQGLLLEQCTKRSLLTGTGRYMRSRTHHLTVGSLICNACLHLLLALLNLQSKLGGFSMQRDSSFCGGCQLTRLGKLKCC